MRLPIKGILTFPPKSLPFRHLHEVFGPVYSGLHSLETTHKSNILGSPSRPAGMAPKSLFLRIFQNISHRGCTNPGATQLAVMLREATSAARALVMPVMPALDAA